MKYPIPMDHHILARNQELVFLIKKKKREERICYAEDFAVLMDHSA